MSNQTIKMFCILLLLFISFTAASICKLNTTPVIGILTQPTSSTDNIQFQKMGKYYIPSSYVKWVEAAGARVVPVPYNADESKLEEIFHTINGLLLPGGDVYLPQSSYQNMTKFLYDLALKANDEGNYFPIWATCQGLEQLFMITSQNSSILEFFNAENLSLPLIFTTEAASSRLFGNMEQNLWHIYQTMPVTENLHELGATPEAFTFNHLDSFYKVLSINFDRDNKGFISTVEAINYPIYGTQWHPERNQFEWDVLEPIDHSYESVICVQYLVNFFVEETRKNQQSWHKVVYDLIDHYPPTYSAHANRYYITTYFWN